MFFCNMLMHYVCTVLRQKFEVFYFEILVLRTATCTGQKLIPMRSSQ